MILRKGMRALLTAGVVLIATAGSAQKLQDVEIRSAGEASRIVLHVDGAVTHKAFALTNPDRLVFDLTGVQNAVKVGSRSVPGGPVKSVRVAQFASDPQPVTRVVADLRGAAEHRVERQGNKLVFEIRPKVAGKKPVVSDVAQVKKSAVHKAVAQKDVAKKASKSVTPKAVAQAKPAVKKDEDTVAQVFPVPVQKAPVSKSKKVAAEAKADKKVAAKGQPKVVDSKSSVKPVPVAKADKAVKTDKAVTDKVVHKDKAVEKPKAVKADKSKKTVSKAAQKKMQKAEAAKVEKVDSKKVVQADPVKPQVAEAQVSKPAPVQKATPQVKPVSQPKPAAVKPVQRQTATTPVAPEAAAQPQAPVAKPQAVPARPAPEVSVAAPRPVQAQPSVPSPASVVNPRAGVQQHSNPGVKSWNTQTYVEDTSPKLNLTSTSRRINLDVQGADIRTVLRTLADYAGMNIIASRDVQGEVSASLKDAPWESALEAILRAHGYGYVQENGIIRVGNLERIRSEELDEAAAARKREELLPIETRVAHMEFANASELKTSLVEMMTPRGNLQVDERTNSLIISDIPHRVELIAQMANQLDSRTPQVEIVSKIVDISNEDSKNLGIEWSAANVMAGQALGGVGVSAPTAGAIGGMRLGTVQSWGQLDLMLDALASQKKANVISNPTITTVNNREAKILVGSKIPLIVADEAGNAITQLTTIGIQMRVTPHVNSDNTISLDLHPEISELSSKATVQGGVIINTSEADTRVIVQNGETAIIGGLIRDIQSEVKTGIPVLQDIPLVGWLFRNSNISDDKRELIIFVTPRMINGDLGQG